MGVACVDPGCGGVVGTVEGLSLVLLRWCSIQASTCQFYKKN